MTVTGTNGRGIGLIYYKSIDSPTHCDFAHNMNKDNKCLARFNSPTGSTNQSGQGGNETNNYEVFSVLYLNREKVKTCDSNLSCHFIPVVLGKTRESLQA